MMNKQCFYSSGKLLLTGEYVVLDGAKSLALPTTFGQSLLVESHDSELLVWESYTYTNALWFSCTIKVALDGFKVKKTSDGVVSKRLLQILSAISEFNPKFTEEAKGKRVKTHLEFPNYWGLGTSSTLISNLSQWAKINPYKLLHKTFGGSGYDIACAQSKTPITYQREGSKLKIHPVTFNPSFKEQLFFVYLNKKQNSRDGIEQYKKTTIAATTLKQISELTDNMLSCKHFDVFCDYMDLHEQIISEQIKLPTVKSKLFNDFKGSIKSLGAWGGDFILVASTTHPKAYFKAKGFETIQEFNEMFPEF